MKVLAVYYSETSHTGKVAESIHEEASKKHETDLKRLEEVEVEDLHGYDFIFVGSPCHDSNLAKPMLRFLESIPSNPPFSIAGFYTHSAYTRDDPKFKRAEEIFDMWAAKGLRTFERLSREKGIEYKGHFNCMGAPNPGIEAFIKRAIIQDEDEWGKYIEEVKKHPNAEDIKKRQVVRKRALSLKRYSVSEAHQG